MLAIRKILASQQNIGSFGISAILVVFLVTWYVRCVPVLLRKFLEELEDAEYPLYLTPVLLASQLHRTDILQLLLSRPDASNELHPLTGTIATAQQL